MPIFYTKAPMAWLASTDIHWTTTFFCSTCDLCLLCVIMAGMSVCIPIRLAAGHHMRVELNIGHRARLEKSINSTLYPSLGWMGNI